MSVRGRQSPAMDAAQRAIESGLMKKKEAAEKFGVSPISILRKDWYQAHVAKLNVGVEKKVSPFPITKNTAGFSRHPMRATWNQMMRRCYVSKVPDYPSYGGRGICVEERWHNLRNFVEDVGQKPSPLHQVDRINNDGNYGPGNFRWATLSEQKINSRQGILAAKREKCVFDVMRAVGRPVSVKEIAEFIGENWTKSQTASAMRGMILKMLIRKNAIRVSEAAWLPPEETITEGVNNGKA